KLLDWMRLEGNFSIDRIFNERGSMQIVFTFPKSACRKNKMNQNIYRHEIIVLDTYCKWRANW
ncbi:MAG: hypothetical protein KAR79_01675, partial [Simkaniaceae bacterium]|nr:hypothetical protein [Simkaniaceae bacterium]